MTTPLQSDIIELFEELAQALGVPRSVGEILGLVFAAEEPVSFDDVVQGLGISKGSASQGLRLLQEVGAVHAVELAGDRRTYYRPELSLRALVGGLLSQRLRPHLARGADHIARIEEAAREKPLSDEMQYRVQLLRNWHRRTQQLLPWVERLVGAGKDASRRRATRDLAPFSINPDAPTSD